MMVLGWFSEGSTRLLESSTIPSRQIPYLFELRHPVPRPILKRQALLKKLKDQYIIATIHKEDLVYDPTSPEH